MRELKIKNGVQEFKINGDENKILRINTADLQILNRAKKAETELKEIANECININQNMSNDESIDLLDKYDKKVKKTIDYIFNTNASQVVFGEMNCLSICDGQPVFKNFLDEILPVITTDIESETKKSQANINKYTSQVKK